MHILYTQYKHPRILGTKTVIDNNIIEQVHLFNYLRNMISYEKELDIDNKLHDFLKIIGILNYVFRPQKPIENQNKIIQYTGPSVLLYRV